LAQCFAGGTALHWAAASGNKDLMATLMERAFDVNSPCYSGQTPLHVAAACGHDNIVRLLLSDNAQPDVGANILCCLHILVDLS
jgi:ankyrin repeat protein